MNEHLGRLVQDWEVGPGDAASVASAGATALRVGADRMLPGACVRLKLRQALADSTYTLTPVHEQDSARGRVQFRFP